MRLPIARFANLTKGVSAGMRMHRRTPSTHRTERETEDVKLRNGIPFSPAFFFSRLFFPRFSPFFCRISL